MNKLLSFYIPKITLEILKFFGFTIALAVVINLMPIDSEVKRGFTKFFLYFVFPAVSYFNRVMYLPPSLDWILLTPIKKLHVVLVHGLINIYKIVFMLVLISIFLFFYEEARLGDFTGIWMFFAGDERIHKTFTRLPANDLAVFTGFFGLLAIFIFGILPNYVQSIQQRQSYHIKRPLKEKIRSYLLVFVGLILAVVFLSEDGTIDMLIPWFLKTSGLFTIFFFVAIYSTLTSLRYYFSKKIFGASGLVCFVLVSSFFYMYASKDIHSTNLHVREKIESINFLGSYASQSLDDAIENDLLANGPSLASLTQRDLKSFLKDIDRMELYSRVVGNWQQACAEKLNFTCRLAYYAHSIVGKKDIPIDMVIKSCPSDVGSCVFIHDNKDVSKEEQQKAYDILVIKCKDNKNEFEQKICNSFNQYASKKKKIK